MHEYYIFLIGFSCNVKHGTWNTLLLLPTTGHELVGVKCCCWHSCLCLKHKDLGECRELLPWGLEMLLCIRWYSNIIIDCKFMGKLWFNISLQWQKGNTSPGSGKPTGAHSTRSIFLKMQQTIWLQIHRKALKYSWSDIEQHFP